MRNVGFMVPCALVVAHRLKPAQSGWPADSTSATRATQNVDDWLTIARRLSLYENNSLTFPYRDFSKYGCLFDDDFC